VVPLPRADRYLGFIIARAESPEAVEAALREAHEHLTFDIRQKEDEALEPELCTSGSLQGRD
jgi:hypothetical protein